MLQEVDEGSSSAASNRGEKWLPHITSANSPHVTSGFARNRIAREWRMGRTIRLRPWGVETRRSSVMGAPSISSGAATKASSRCWTMCTENSVVS